MRLKEIIPFLVAVFTIFAILMAEAQETPREVQPQAQLTKGGGNDGDRRMFDSVVVHSAVAPQKAAVPLALSKGRPITGKEDFMAAKWSPDSRYLLLTKGKYRGLFLLSLEDHAIRALSRARRIGYEAKWSPDGRYIITREDERVKILDLNGNQIAAENNALEEEGAPAHTEQIYTKDDAVYFRSAPGRPEIKISQGNDSFFMPQLSPDRKKIAYIGLSSGIHIMNLESRRTATLGLGTDIVWMPDSSAIIYTYTRDNGHRITASDLYFAYADGSLIINLTHTSGTLESHAEIAPKGNALVYVVDGQVFLSELTYRHPVEAK